MSSRSPRVRRQRAVARAARRRMVWRLGSAVVVALAVVAVLIVAGRPENDLPAVEAARVDYGEIPTSGWTLGQPNAPVTVVAWADYQCPYCGVFARDVEPRLIAEYVATGRVRFEFRPLPFLGDESVQATEAAACALDQGQFWGFHETLFANQHGENEGAFSDERLRSMARQLRLDEHQFDQCLDGATHEAEVGTMRDEARRQGITSTPTLAVNGTIVPSWDYATLKQAIDAALAVR